MKILLSTNSACPMSRLLERLAKSAFKRLVLTMPLYQHLLLRMSSTPTSYKLSNAYCEKGHVSQRLPIPYAVSKNGLLVSTLRETIKTKTPKGESKQSFLGNGADGEEYVKHLMSFFHFMEKKGYKADLKAAFKGHDYSPEEACKSSTRGERPSKSRKTYQSQRLRK
jgi:hypothetical protein